MFCGHKYKLNINTHHRRKEITLSDCNDVGWKAEGVTRTLLVRRAGGSTFVWHALIKS